MLTNVHCFGSGGIWEDRQIIFIEIPFDYLTTITLEMGRIS